MSPAAFLLVSLVAVPPGELMYDHNQPGQWGHPPVVRYAMIKAIDNLRGEAWMDYTSVLDRLWVEYRAAGSTPEAWEIYKLRAAAAKRAYVFQDPWYVAVIPPVPPRSAARVPDPAWKAPRPPHGPPPPYNPVPWQSLPGAAPYGAPYGHPAVPPVHPFTPPGHQGELGEGAGEAPPPHPEAQEF